MGTSSSYGGLKGKTPLVPTWLGGDSESPPDENNEDSNLDDTGQDDGTGQESPKENPSTDSDNQEQNKQPDEKRFTQVRNNFTRFVNSGGYDRRALGNAVSSYVSRASGGAKTASQRMGSSRNTTGGLINFLQSVRNEGSENTLRSFGLGNLVGQPIEDIFIELMELICPEGGNVDEGIARNAFIETIAELGAHGITNLDALTIEQIQTIIEVYASHAIEARLCNDIGTKIFIAPENIPLVENIQEQLHDFISRGVSDALHKIGDRLSTLTSEDTAKFVDEIYSEAFSMLEILGDSENN